MAGEHISGRRGRPSRDEVYRRLDLQIAELWQRLGGLPHPDEAADIWRGIWYEEAHHSTAIEGNTLVLKQVEQLLLEGLAVGSKQLSEYMEVRGYADAAEWVYQQSLQPGSWGTGRIISLAEIREIHRRTMTPVWDVAPHPDATPRESPGNFREHDIHPFPDGMVPTTWPLVAAELDSWLERADGIEPRTKILADQLAVLHSEFERIHPFLDGNGRVGRLVLNVVLLRLGYPPAIIYKRQRIPYLRALRQADRGEPGALGEILARAILGNLYRFIVPAVAGPARLVPLAALATRDTSAASLRVAAARGRLQATQGPDGQWRSSRNWVDEYRDNRYRRRAD